MALRFYWPAGIADRARETAPDDLGALDLLGFWATARLLGREALIGRLPGRQGLVFKMMRGATLEAVCRLASRRAEYPAKRATAQILWLYVAEERRVKAPLTEFGGWRTTQGRHHSLRSLLRWLEEQGERIEVVLCQRCLQPMLRPWSLPRDQALQYHQRGRCHSARSTPT